MVQNEEIFLEDPLHQYCCSWLSLQVANVGTSLFVASWNAHPIPGTCAMRYMYLFIRISGWQFVLHFANNNNHIDYQSADCFDLNQELL